MNTTEVNSIMEFLEIVKILSNGGVKLWYRGVASKDFKLQPALYWTKESQHEASYIHDFLVGYKAYTNNHNLRAWDIYALMQHHGLRTRLLDWSKSPLNALFFALTQEAEMKSKRVVYILHPHLYNEEISGLGEVFCPAGLENRVVKLKDNKQINLDSYLPEALAPDNYDCIPNKPLAIETPLNQLRIKAQNGCFTVHGKLEKTLDSFLKPNSIAISCVILNTLDTRSEWLSELYAYGINEEVIFQDIDHLAKRINREQFEFKIQEKSQ